MTINDILLNLARTQVRLKPEIDALKQQKNAATAALNAAQTELETADKATHEAIMQYIQETGDLTPHPLVTFRRTTDLMYDRQSAIETLIDWELSDDEYDVAAVVDLLIKGKLGDYLTIKVELDVRKFESDLRDDKVATGIDYETVPAPQIAIGKLGSLLIEAGEA